MATIIDSLLVILGLDASGMKTGAEEAAKAHDKIERDAEKSAAGVTAAGKQRDAASAAALKKRTTDESAALKKKSAEETKAEKEREAAAKKMAEGLGKVRNEILGISAALFGAAALKSLTSDLVQVDTHLGRMSGTLGQSVEDLNAWEMAMSKAGVTAAETEDAFRNTNKLQEGLKKGDIGKFAEYFKTVAALTPNVKIDSDKLFDQELDAKDRLMVLARASMQMSQKDAALTLEKLGYSEDVARALQRGDVWLAEQLVHARAIDKDIKKAVDGSGRLSENWAEIKNRTKGVGDSILTDMTPAIEKGQHALEGFLDYAAQHIPETEVAIGGLSAGLLAASAVSFVGLASGLGAIGAIIAGLVAGVEALVGGLLIYSGWKAGFKIAEWIGGKFGYHYDDGKGPTAKELDVETPEQAALDMQRNAEIMAGGTGAALPPIKKPNIRPDIKPDIRPHSRPETRQQNEAPITSAPPEVKAAAQASQLKYGIPAEVTIAQWKLESDSGKRMPEGSNNPFGIKAKPGQDYVESPTDELINGQMRRVKQRFAKFATIADAFEAHAKLLGTSPIYAEARQHKDDPEAYTDAMAKHYATDPSYANKLKALMPTAPAAPAQAPDISVKVPDAAGKASVTAPEPVADKMHRMPTTAPQAASAEPAAGQRQRTDLAVERQPDPVATQRFTFDPVLIRVMQPGPPIDRGLLTGAQAAVTNNQTSNINNNQSSNTSHAETHIGAVHINAPEAKTNADVATAMSEKLQNYAFASMSNLGLA